MIKVIALLLGILFVTTSCGPNNAFSASNRQAYRADICGQYLSPESTTPNLAGQGRSCVVKSREQ